MKTVEERLSIIQYKYLKKCCWLFIRIIEKNDFSDLIRPIGENDEAVINYMIKL